MRIQQEKKRWKCYSRVRWNKTRRGDFWVNNAEQESTLSMCVCLCVNACIYLLTFDIYSWPALPHTPFASFKVPSFAAEILAIWLATCATAQCLRYDKEDRQTNGTWPCGRKDVRMWGADIRV